MKKSEFVLFNRESLEFVHVVDPEGSADPLDVLVRAASDWCREMDGRIVSDTSERLGIADWRILVCKQRNPAFHVETYFTERQGRVYRLTFRADDPPESDRKTVLRMLESFVWTKP